MRVAGRAIVCVFGGETIGIFVHIEHAHQNGTGTPHLCDQEGILWGRSVPAIDLGARQCHFALHIKQVLHGIGHAGKQGQYTTTASQGIHGISLLDRTLNGAAGKRVDACVSGGYAPQASVQGLAGTDFSAGNRACQLGSVEQFCHASPCSCSAVGNAAGQKISLISCSKESGKASSCMAMANVRPSCRATASARESSSGSLSKLEAALT